MTTLKKFVALVAICFLFTACASDSNTTTDDTRTDNAQMDNVQKDNGKVDVQTASSHSKPVAVITNYEDIANNITIQRANGTPTGSEALLYPGDTITGNIGDVKIKCAPYADFQTKNGAHVISYDPPSGIISIASNAIDYASSFWNNVESVAAGASRSSDDELNLNPQPGFDVTLMTSQTVRFAWDGSAKNLTIKDETGEKIFETAVSGKNFIEFTPSDANLKVGQKYTWNLDENASSYKFTILDAQIEKEILDGLAKIDAENLSKEKSALKKSAYVQLISDIYPDKVDLYWLSAQWLSEISPTDEKLKENKSVLLRKCARHLDDEM